MNHAQNIVEEIGRERLRSALGVSQQSISDGLSAGRFPARWYLIVRDLYAAQSVGEPPLEGFAWKEVAA
ncbi:hypothetical protein [Oceanicella sp. SM1341]|uniref:hypothetical protein n=1 Tax=Oceanicella sp. SM1341 TaxID=1548889 RepID=UPI000E4C9C68|nr:hypothetical protein [Oceanicella sp. SM1341]